MVRPSNSVSKRYIYVLKICSSSKQRWNFLLSKVIYLLGIVLIRYCSAARILFMPASLILFTGLVPKPSRKMAKTWDQKQTRYSPPCFKHAAKQQWRNLTAGHVSAAFCHFPAAEPNVFQTMEPSLPSVSCKHFYVSTQGYFKTGSFQQEFQFPFCCVTDC